MANTKVTGDLIASSTIATGNIADNAVTSDKISGITTAHITEGSNLYYTDARADARVALLVDSAPSTLNTLNELADALGDDPNYAATTAVTIGLKAPLASPSFTGNATFAGSINAGVSTFNSDGGGTALKLIGRSAANSGTLRYYQNNGTTQTARIESNDSIFEINSISNLPIQLKTNDTLALTIDTSQNATFAGNVAINNSLLVNVNANNEGIQIANSFALDNASTFLYLAGKNTAGTFKTGQLELLHNGSLNLRSGGSGTTTAYGTIALTLDSSQNATFSGNVLIGVGTGNPYLSLVSAGGNGGNERARIFGYADGGTYGGGLQIQTRNDVNVFGTAVTIDHDKNVGIGVAPSQKLEINGAVKFFGATSSNFAQTGGQIDYYDTGRQFRFNAYKADATGAEIVFNTGGTSSFNQRMCIDSSGNVGINETSPDALLDIEMTDTNTYDANALNTATLIAQTFNTSNVNSQASIISLRTTGWAGGTTGIVNIGAVQVGNASSADFVIQTRNAGTYGERMRITAAGALEIQGTATSGANKNAFITNSDTLTMIGSTQSAGTPKDMAFFTGVEAMRIDSSGNTFIKKNLELGEASNTTSGSNNYIPLKINTTYSTTANPQWSLQGWVATTDGADPFAMTSGEVTKNIYMGIIGGAYMNQNRFSIIQGGAERLTVNLTQTGSGSVSGNVGIGTTLPTRKLDVAGEITHEGLVPKNLSAGDVAFIDGLVTINKTVSTTANVWTSLDISLSNIGGTGTFAVQVYSNAHGSTGGAWYAMYWSGIMSWYHTSSNAGDLSEITLHSAGHAQNGNTLELRTKLHTNDGTAYQNKCELQIKTAYALTSAPISFRFRKLI